MRTIQEVLKLSVEFLANKGIKDQRRCAEELLSCQLNMSRLSLYTHFDKPVEEEELQKLRQALKRLSYGEPIAQILGKVSFFDAEITINCDVLIPRVETELLVEKISCKIKENASHKVLLDLCTGSGCIGISLKKKHPHLHVILSDKSQKAVDIARKNSEKNGVDVEILCGDLLEPLCQRKVDILVCNPPYVTAKEWETLDPSVKNFEPKEALVGGEDGLIFYRILAKQLKKVLNPGGLAFFEVGSGQGQAVIDLFKNEGFLKYRLEKDLSSHDRFFSLENE